VSRKNGDAAGLPTRDRALARRASPTSNARSAPKAPTAGSRAKPRPPAAVPGCAADPAVDSVAFRRARPIGPDRLVTRDSVARPERTRACRACQLGRLPPLGRAFVTPRLADVKRARGAGRRPRRDAPILKPRPLAAALGRATVDSVASRCAVARCSPRLAHVKRAFERVAASRRTETWLP